jgi:hypothetical protein
LRIQLLDCSVALSGGFAQRSNKIFGAGGLGCRSLMTGRKNVSAIAIVIALPASAYTIFDGIWAAATARNHVVDGGLIGGDVVTETCGAIAPVTSFVSVEP